MPSDSLNPRPGAGAVSVRPGGTIRERMRFILGRDGRREPTASVACPSRTDGTPRFPPVSCRSLTYGPAPSIGIPLRRSVAPGLRRGQGTSCRMINTDRNGYRRCSLDRWYEELMARQ